jgi:hypothetical protein
MSVLHRSQAARFSLALVRAAFFAAALRELALRRLAADRACFAKAVRDAADFGIFFNAPRTAAERREEVAFFLE